MAQSSINRIGRAYDRIYRQGDRGLDYMDRHPELDTALMQHFYDDTLDQLGPYELRTLAEQLEEVADDLKFDLEVL